MPFVKVVKNKAYFKRFQVKWRRRRSGHTNYGRRHKLITQDKNKYLAPKYRLVVRISNRYCRVQVVAAELDHDRTICSASSQELPRYGIKAGLKNYAACYATGLLCARRLLKSLNLDETYEGVEEVTGACTSYDSTGAEIPEGTRDNGKKFYVEGVEPGERKPFRAYLDIGIRTASRGSRVFAAMKGASDGGMDIPHNNKRFPGYDPDAKTFDADDLKDHIMGAHVGAYMEEMEEDDEENYQKVFKKYIELELKEDDLEGVYESAHAAIRENPEAVKGFTFADAEDSEPQESTAFVFKKTGKEQKKDPKFTYEQRRAASNAKKLALQEE